MVWEDLYLIAHLKNHHPDNYNKFVSTSFLILPNESIAFYICICQWAILREPIIICSTTGEA